MPSSARGDNVIMSKEDLHFKETFSLWRLDVMPPIRRLSWWWWWALILIPDTENPGRSKQLMSYGPQKTLPIRVSGHWWKPGGRMFVDERRTCNTRYGLCMVV